jgi:hypothetical protein
MNEFPLSYHIINTDWCIFQTFIPRKLLMFLKISKGTKCQTNKETMIKEVNSIHRLRRVMDQETRGEGLLGHCTSKTDTLHLVLVLKQGKHSGT